MNFSSLSHLFSFHNSLKIVATIGIILLAGCDQDDAEPVVLKRIEIQSADGTLDVFSNETSSLSLNGYDQNDERFEITTAINWSTNNDHIEVNSDGNVTAVSVGVTIVTATTDGLSSTIELIAWDSSIITRLLISSSSGAKLDVIGNETSNLSVIGYNQENASTDVTSIVTWSTDNDHIELDVNGTATAISVGQTVVTAAIDGVTDTYALRGWDSSAPRVEIYVSDVGVNRNGPHQIIKYAEDGSDPQIFINSGLSSPQDMVFVEDQGFVLVSNYLGNNINKYDIETGDFIETFASIPGGPTRIDVGPDGLLYVIQWTSGGVQRYNLDGSFVGNFTSPIFNAIGMDWDTDGNLYVSSFNNGSDGFVKKFDSQGVDLGAFVSNDLIGPTDIWFDDEGNLYVNDWNGNNVKKFSQNGDYLGIFVSNVSQPEGVAHLDDGSILIGASGTGSIAKYSSNGALIKNLVAGGGLLETPNAVVIRKVNFD